MRVFALELRFLFQLNERFLVARLYDDGRFSQRLDLFRFKYVVRLL